MRFFLLFRYFVVKFVSAFCLQNKSVGYIVVSENWKHNNVAWSMNFFHSLIDAQKVCKSGCIIYSVIGSKKILTSDPIICAFTYDYKPIYNSKTKKKVIPSVFELCEVIYQKK